MARRAGVKATADNMNTTPKTKRQAPICESYMTNFVRCLKTATHREICPNGIMYYCDHHAAMRKRQDGILEPI